MKNRFVVNRGSRLLLTQRRSQTQRKAQEPRFPRIRVLTRRATLKVRTTRSPLLSLEKFLETAKGLQLLQETERRTVDGTGDDEEEPDTSDNDQYSCQNARQRGLRRQRRARIRILLDEMSEDTSPARTVAWSFDQSASRRATSIGRRLRRSCGNTNFRV